MTMPMPMSGEEHDAFMERCMGDSMMNGEFPDGEQRRAVCEKQWGEPTEMDAHGGRRSVIADGRLVAFKTADFAGDAQTVDVQICPDGAIESVAGDCILDDIAWAEIEKRFRAMKTELLFDYEHQSEGAPYNTRPDGLAPAAGQIVDIRRERGNGLIAKVRWTDEARKRIRAREYLYPSPVFMVRKGDDRAVELISVGLVNQPAMVGARKVAAKKMNNLAVGQRKDINMDELKLIGKDLELAEADCKVEIIRNKIGETKKKAATAEASSETFKKVCKAAGCAETVSETELLARVTAMKSEQSTLTKQAEELKALSKRIAERDADELLAVHGKGKLNPNAKEQMAVFKQLAAESPERCIKVLSEMPVICPEGRTTPPEGGATAGDKSRETIIANSAKKFRDDASLHKLTTCKDFVSLALQDAGQARLSDEESKKLVG